MKNNSINKKCIIKIEINLIMNIINFNLTTYDFAFFVILFR